MTPYQRRFGIDFKGKLVPFGAEIRYMHFEGGRAVRNHPIGDKTHPALFMGYVQYPGGKWTGDYWVLDFDKIASASSINNLHCKRVKDIVVPEYFVFPLSTGKLKQPELADGQSFVSDLDEDDRSDADGGDCHAAGDA